MAAQDTTDINIRRVPRELVRKAKIHAAQNEITLRQLVLDAIEKAVKSGGGK